MEITSKGLLAVIIPTLITACFTTIDNSLRWRAEMEQKQFDRQTKLLDQIISIPDASHRRTLAEFYISTGVFTGGYLKQLESTLSVAQETVANVSDTKSADYPQVVMEEALAAEDFNSIDEPQPAPIYPDEVYSEPSEPNAGMSAAPSPEPIPEPAPEVVTEPFVQPPVMQNIFLYDNLKQ